MTACASPSTRTATCSPTTPAGTGRRSRTKRSATSNPSRLRRAVPRGDARPGRGRRRAVRRRARDQHAHRGHVRRQGARRGRAGADAGGVHVVRRPAGGERQRPHADRAELGLAAALVRHVRRPRGTAGRGARLRHGRGGRAAGQDRHELRRASASARTRSCPTPTAACRACRSTCCCAASWTRRTSRTRSPSSSGDSARRPPTTWSGTATESPSTSRARPATFPACSSSFPDGGVLTHTNHFLSPAFDGRDVSLWVMPDSPFRLERIRSQVTAAAAPCPSSRSNRRWRTMPTTRRASAATPTRATRCPIRAPRWHRSSWTWTRAGCGSPTASRAATPTGRSTTTTFLSKPSRVGIADRAPTHRVPA